MNNSSYLSPFLTERLVSSRKGLGTFAAQDIRKGSILAVFGGDIRTHEQLDQCPADSKMNCIQISKDLYLVPSHVGAGDHINHSCEPNAGIRGQIVLVALRDIRSGEEICYDYAMTDSSDYDEFECLCGTHGCRGRITGNDWRLPELQARYRGYFSTYLEDLLLGGQVNDSGVSTSSNRPLATQKIF
jgi:SET domain-containing protein